MWRIYRVKRLYSYQQMQISLNIILLQVYMLMSRLSYSLLVQPQAAPWLPATSVNCCQISFPSEMKDVYREASVQEVEVLCAVGRYRKGKAAA